MILIGSAAALRTDSLPQWRGCQPLNDYDLVGTDEEFFSLADHFRQQGFVVIEDHSRMTNFKGMRVTQPERRGRILIDWFGMGLESSQILAGMDDLEDGIAFNQSVKLASPLIQYVTRRASSYLMEPSEKIELDTAHWRQWVADNGLSLTDSHVALYRAIRAEYASRLAP